MTMFVLLFLFCIMTTTLVMISTAYLLISFQGGNRLKGVKYAVVCAWFVFLGVFVYFNHTGY